MNVGDRVQARDGTQGVVTGFETTPRGWPLVRFTDRPRPTPGTYPPWLLTVIERKTMSENLPALRDEAGVFELNQRRAKAYSESGYWPDASKLAQALVKIEAGRSLGINPLMAMNEIHVIEGKPGVGAGACAALVKAHPRYDYRVNELTGERCTISFYERGHRIGVSTFTLDDAKTAKLMNRGNWITYPRNMLYARAMTNGVGWFCPDVFMGKVYTPEELGDDSYPPPELPDAGDVTPIDDPYLVDEDIEFGDPLEADSEAELQTLEALHEMTDE
jgi:hypothetical protein